jgi:hypothetical protein
MVNLDLKVGEIYTVKMPRALGVDTGVVLTFKGTKYINNSDGSTTTRKIFDYDATQQRDILSGTISAFGEAILRTEELRLGEGIRNLVYHADCLICVGNRGAKK